MLNEMPVTFDVPRSGSITLTALFPMRGARNEDLERRGGLVVSRMGA